MSNNPTKYCRKELLNSNFLFDRQILLKLVLSMFIVLLLIVTGVTKSDTPAYEPRGFVAELFGINEALSDPEKFERSNNFDVGRLRKRLERQGNATVSVGTQWTRGHTVAFPRLNWDRWERENHSFERADTWIKAVQSVGLEPVVMIGPWPGNQTREFTRQYSLKDSDKGRYIKFVRETVERYDGDGIRDMPGLLKGVRYWEVDNEPDLKNSGSPRLSKRTNFCTPEQYATVLIATSKAIRTSDPNAKILNGGFYRVVNEFGYNYMKDLLSIPGVYNAIDVISVHAYHPGRNVREVDLALTRTQNLARGKPMWLTETSVPSDGGKEFQSPAWQAEILARTVVLVLAYRVESFFGIHCSIHLKGKHPIEEKFCRSQLIHCIAKHHAAAHSNSNRPEKFIVPLPRYWGV